MKNTGARISYSFVIVFLFNLAANMVHPVTPTIILDLGLNDYMFGVALAAMMLCNFLFSPFWGKIAGYISSRSVMLICGLGYGLGQAFLGLSQTEGQFLLARMFAGAFCGGAYIAFTTYIVNCSPEEKRGRNLALYAMLISVSNSFGYFVGGMLGEITTYLPLWVQVVASGVTGFLYYIGCRDDRIQDIRELSPRQLLREGNPFSAILQCRRFMSRMMIFLLLSYTLGSLGNVAFEQCFNYYLRDQFGLSSGYNGVIKAALGVISLVANSTLCMWLLKRRSITGWLVGVMSLCTLSMLGVIAFEAVIPFIVVNVIFFAFYYISVPLTQDRVAALGKGEDSNLVMAAFNGVKAFGCIFGSALAGFLYEAHVKFPFVFGFIAFAAATWAMVIAWKTEAAQNR